MPPKTPVEANATVVRHEALGGCLYRLWVRPDWDIDAKGWHAGQFVRLGIPEGVPEDRKNARAYSFAGVTDGVFEFYIVEVEGGKTSPRLNKLRADDRLWCEEKISGHFSLDRNPPGKRCIMVGTGAGIAPFLCMVRHGGEAYSAYEQVVLVHQVRHREHLVYADELAAWAGTQDRHRYVPILSKPASRFTSLQGHAPLHGYVQDRLEDGTLDAVAGSPLSPDDTVVMLCGNPDMIKSMTAALEARGLNRHKKSRPGHVITERYW